MGLFGSKKKTYVSSTLYNLAGDPTGKPSFKRTAVAGAIVRGNDIPTDLRNSYLSGFAISTRSFARWGVTSGYNDAVGLMPSQMALQSSFSQTKIQEYLQQTYGGVQEVLQSGAGPADVSLWADKFMIDQHLSAGAESLADGVAYDYTVSADTTSLTVFVGDTPAAGAPDTRPSYVVPLENFDRNANYVYAVYRANTQGDPKGTVLGDWRIIDGITITGPNLTGWTLHSGTQNVSTPVVLRTTVTASTKAANGSITTAAPVVTTRTEQVPVTRDEWRREVYIGSSKTDSLDLEAERQAIERDYSYVVVEKTTTAVTTGSSGGVPTTTTTTTVRQEIQLQKRYRESVNTVTTRRYGPVKMLLYKVGTGVAELDSLFRLAPADVDWMPFIPVRLDNKFVEERDPELYQLTRKAFRKAFGRRVKLESIIESLEDNKSLKDIDFAHIAFGVSFNTKSQWGKQYIFTYLQKLAQATGSSKATFDNYNTQYNAHKNYAKAMQEWNTAQEGSWGGSQSKPVEVAAPVRPHSAISFKSSRSDMHFNQRIEFDFLYEERGTGRRMVDGKPAKIGSLWWEILEEGTEDALLLDMRSGENNQQGLFSRAFSRYLAAHALYWQASSREWHRMVIRGGKHINYPYRDHAITIYAEDALKDEDESGFFFPLNLAIFKGMGIVDGTEMNNCSAYLILNSYQVVKKKWYQTGIFAVIVAIVVIVISYFYPPAAGTAGGVLGTNAAVGAAIVGAGASAAVIALVGAIANAVAGMILGAIIARAASKVFGNSILGQIIAVAAVIMLGNYQTAGANGTSMSFAESFGSLMRAENLLKLGMSAVSGFSDYINASTMNILQEAEALREAYSAESRRIQEMYVEQFGAGKVIDPMAFTTAGQGKVESMDAFLSRTLMTGMDIAETTHSMLSEFASLTLTLDTKV